MWIFQFQNDTAPFTFNREEKEDAKFYYYSFVLFHYLRLEISATYSFMALFTQ
jgi:hypothetical protein